MNWLNELKIAYLNKNDERLSQLLDNTPMLKTREEMFEALAILEQITSYAKAQKDALWIEMKKLKQTKQFLPKEQKISRLNISF
ncbi:hypothetical protein B6S12_02640 [Helicobacter valdiviensis]|uniref:Uncharacterized protein n=1 Tax=Helicobacter valdiviensis TaxID=1458358 RepID=A0A2W6MZH2_9HELI|nr:hypothetical protein [Helicobacter valdiviensis]PZT48758.1 hypothetical protein B6S12_02640 [Helicobacter valdiviensis]